MKDALKDDLQCELDEILRGVIRVPALLLTNPTQSLSSVGMDKYEVVGSEPLHDLKGHLISSCLAKEKKSGADLRRVAIQVYLLLRDLEVSPKVLQLLQTVIKMGEIAYSFDSARSPRQLLQLYNTCWLHMELCRDLLAKPKKISTSKMFGHYIHALTVHSPTQFELSSLRSLNTENQERLFGQARVIAESCTNHHTENVIPQVYRRWCVNNQ